MTWLEFKDAVKVFCTVDAVRLNTGNLFEQLTRQAVIDLQSYVEEMRFPHETKYYSPADLSEDGLASVGMLPDQAILRDMYYVKDNVEEAEENNVCARSPMQDYDWANRYDLVCGNVALTGCRYKIALSPQATTFYAFPKVAEGYHLSLFWEGQRLEFDNASVVPFGERSVMAAAMFVKSGIIREVDKDPQLALAYMGLPPRPGVPMMPGTYFYLRSQCYLDGRDRRRFQDDTSSPQPEANCANTLTCVAG